MHGWDQIVLVGNQDMHCKDFDSVTFYNRNATCVKADY